MHPQLGMHIVSSTRLMGTSIPCRQYRKLVVQGNINVIEAAKEKGVRKFVLVTSIGTGDSKEAPPKQVYDVLKPVLLQKEKAEQRLKASDLN